MPFSYNTYGPGRTRPLSRSEAHWKNLRIGVSMQMRKPVLDPGHRMPPGLNNRIKEKRRQGKESMAAFLTPV